MSFRIKNYPGRPWSIPVLIALVPIIITVVGWSRVRKPTGYRRSEGPRREAQLAKAVETYWLLYKMVEEILSLKEEKRGLGSVRD